MKPVMTKDDVVCYVSESTFIEFVRLNSDYEWNELCHICTEEVFTGEGRTYFDEKPTGNEYSEFTVKWIGAFYDAHPFLKHIMFVFDD